MGLPRPRLGIPAKLLLVSSLLLLIPWLGLALRARAGAAGARTRRSRRSSRRRGAVAIALNDRPNVLLPARSTGPASPERDLRVLDLAADRRRRPGGRLGRPGARGAPRSRAGRRGGRGAAVLVRYRIGRHGNGVYALFEVQDDRASSCATLRPELGRRRPPRDRGRDGRRRVPALRRRRGGRRAGLGLARPRRRQPRPGQPDRRRLADAPRAAGPSSCGCRGR